MKPGRSAANTLRPLMIGCAAAMLGGVLAGFIATGRPSGEAPKAPAVRWMLPNVGSRLAGNPSDLGTLLQHNPFGAAGGTPQASTGGGSNGGMRLVGVVEDEGPVALFYTSAGRRLLRVRPGGELPGFGRIGGIAGGAVTIHLRGCEKTIRLFSNNAPVIDGCAAGRIPSPTHH